MLGCSFKWGVVREGFVEKVMLEQKWKEVREGDTKLFGQLVLKAEETTGVKAQSRRELRAPRGSKETGDWVGNFGLTL